MKQAIHLIQSDGKDLTLSTADVAQHLGTARNPLILEFQSPAALRIGRGVLRHFTRLIEDKRANRREQRIDAMMDGMLDLDPFDEAEAGIDVDNAEIRTRFLEEFPVLTSAAIHARAGHTSKNAAQTAASWKRAGRILSLSYRGRDLFPAFQFDADGRPWPLLKEVLATLPQDLTSWQRAFWLVAEDFRLDGRKPIDLIQIGDRSVLEAARHAGVLPIG